MPKKTKDNTKSSTRDTFQTPNYGTELITPYLIPNSVVWECAAGAGKMVNVLTQHGHRVYASDIAPAAKRVMKYDFLGEPNSEAWPRGINYIITNPPFGLKRKFYSRCLYYYNLYKIPFALLIPADYSGWIIRAVQNGAQKLVPTRRIDYITPTGLDGSTGKHTADFHSMWLMHGFGISNGDAELPTEIFVELSLKDKENI